MKTRSTILALLAFVSFQTVFAQEARSILPSDGIITYLPEDTTGSMEAKTIAANNISFKPSVNFFFRPETTNNYKEAGMPEDTGKLNFYLRGDVGAILSLPKNIDFVFNLHSYGLYTRALGPLDPNLTLYEAYVDMKSLDRAGKMSLRFGRASLGKYGTEMLVGDDDFGRGRSFETVRWRYQGDRSRHDFMWVQLYQQAPPGANFDWNHPIFLGTFNTFEFSESFNLDVNLPFLIDQYNSGFRTTVLMPDVRIFGNINQLAYTAEVIYQTGQTNGILNDNIDGSVSAYAFEAGLGYFNIDRTFAINGAYYLGSGDDDLTDEDVNNYNVLWQNEHRRFGYIDAFRGSNVNAFTLHINKRVGQLVDIGVHGVYASVLEQTDPSTGIALLPLNNLDTDSKAIGMGVDAYINYYFNEYFNMQFAVAAFSPGDYFTAVTGMEDLMMRTYLMFAARI
jgi:hypothetical protein